MQYLTIWDLVLTPIYLIVLIAIARRQRDKRYPPGHPLRPYFLKGLYVKLAGAIFIALIYQFYYGGGDTFNFFYHSKVINSALDNSFSTWLKLIVHAPIDNNPQLYPYVSQMYWYHDTSSYTVAAITAILGLLNGTTYLPIALLFAYISYTGIWAMYRTFISIYPKLYKQLAIAFLYIPSTVVWGSAVFKDTVCIFGLGWITYASFRIFINKDLSLKNMTMLVVSFYLIAIIKVYILLAFLPALGIWLLLSYSHKIKQVVIRWVVNLLFIGVSIGGFLFLTRRFANALDKYSLENIAQTAVTTRGWINYVSGRDEGSGYDLGTFDPTVSGMLRKFPQAVFVTLYRPFLWEARKAIMVLSALEAGVFLWFTLFTFYKRGILSTFKNIFTDPNLLFFFVYTLIFAFAVGISTGNFGTLSRYKIPAMPFFTALLLILYYKDQKLTRGTLNAKTNNRAVRHIA